MEILKNPTTVKMMASQIMMACDEYIAKRMTEKQLKELLFHYASRHGRKLFSITGFNPTIANRIGKKRLELMNLMLEGFQFKI